MPFLPGHLAVDAASHVLFVSSSGGGSSTNFIAMDDRTFQTLYALHLGNSPDVVSPASPDVFVSDPGADQLYELDGAT